MRRHVARIIAMSSIGIMLLFSSGWCVEADSAAPGQRGETSGAGMDAGKASEASGANVQPADMNTQPEEKTAPQAEKAAQPEERGAGDKSTDELINELKARRIITEEQASWLLQKYQGRNVKPSGGAFDEDAFVKEVAKELSSQMKQDVQTQVKEELKAQIIKEARMGNWLTPSLPEWVSRIKIGGDIRLRYQGDYFGDDNAEFLKPSDPTKIMNTTVDRQRLRGRFRLTLNTQVTDTVESGVQITTGSTSDPVSTNFTMGDYLNKKSVVLDRVYIRYRPLPELTLWGGRFANPWFSTDLVWDNDLNFEGVAAQFDSQIGRPFRGFVTLGLFPIQEVENSARDKWLYAAQTGISIKLTDFLNMKTAIAYYDFRNIEGKANTVELPNENDWTAPQFQQVGNTLFDIDPSTSYKVALASGYNELNYTFQLDMSAFDPVHVIFLFDRVQNLGFDRKDVSARTGVSNPMKEVTGYKTGLSVGYIKVQEPLEWQFYLYKKYLEADAVVDAFTDSDFHLGGTNCEGWIAGLQFGLAKNCWLETKWMTSDAIEGPQFAVDTFQVDVNVRF
jgi:hypothetical protein